MRRGSLTALYLRGDKGTWVRRGTVWVDPKYELPPDLSINSLEVNVISNSNFPELIQSEASIVPTSDNYYQLGDPAHKWIEGHFTSIYADNLNVTDAGGTTRRVLLEGDAVNASVSWSDVSGQ